MKLIPTAVARTAGSQLLKLKTNSPRLMFAAGLAGVVTSTVLASQASRKLDRTLDIIEDENREIRDAARINGIELSKRDVLHVKTKQASTVLRLYGPAVVVGVAGVVCLSGAHVTLSRRNAGLTAAYAAVAKGFDEYRGRVREELGEETEAKVYRGITTVTEKVEGKSVKVDVKDPNVLSPHAVCFDETRRDWSPNAEINKQVLTCQQDYANFKLKQRGHVFLNEVYDALGMEHTKAGAVVGWIDGGEGDNYIDFGMYEARNEDFITGRERSIWLDFNVDGTMFDKI